MEPAKKNIDFLLNSICTANNSLFRNFKSGKATIFAFLDDYAFLITALIEFYEVSFDEVYLQKARALAEYVEAHFFDKASGMYFYTDAQHSNLITRKMEVTDNVIPASNSEMARNLSLLSLYFEDKNYESHSIQMIKNVINDMKKNPGYYSNWGRLLTRQIYSTHEIAVVGQDWNEKMKEFNQYYLPGVLFSGGENEGILPLLQNKWVAGKTMIYVCHNKTCRLPVEEVEDALKQIKD